MKVIKGYLLLGLFCCAVNFCFAGDRDSIGVFIEQTQMELVEIQKDFNGEKLKLEYNLFQIEKDLYTASDRDALLMHLVDKAKTEREIKILNNEFRTKLAKRRFRKGIELIRLLYEKIIGLEYHFSAVESNQGLMDLANPMSFPEFAKVKTSISKRLRKKSEIQLPDILQNNPFASSSFFLANALMGEGSKKDKERDLEKIACIIDFTVQMNTDLKIIFFETEYLKASNATLKEDCISLFKEYTKVIGYESGLVECRDADDWDNVLLKLDLYVEEMTKLYDGNPEEVKLAFKKNSSLEFPFMLMTAFIHKYNNFIGQGKNYYRKFGIIMSNYANKITCEGILPEKFKTLGEEINHSVQKFDEAYHIPELKGSKLKDLLYGYDD